MHGLVNLDAVHGAEHVAGVAHAKERGRVHRRQAEGLLAEVGVLASGGVGVVALDGSRKRVSRDAELLSKLFHRVGLLDEASLLHALKHAHAGIHVDGGDGRAVHEREHARAALGLELHDVVLEVGVPDGGIGVTRLVDGRVKHEIVRGALVAEALALEVHLEPGLRGHPHHAVDHLTAGKRVGRQRAAVEQHGGMDVVERGARPDAGLDAVALGTGDAGIEGENELGLGLERREHLVVEGIAAGADTHALSSVDAHVTVGTLGDDARHAAGLVLLKLDHGAAVTELDAVVGGVRLEDLAVFSRAAVLHASVTGCPVAVLHLVGILVEVMVGAIHKLTAGLLAQVAVPLDRLGRLVGPQAKELGVDVGGGVHGHLTADVERLDVSVVGELVLGADGAKGTANAGAHLVLLDDKNLRAVLGGRAGSEKTRSARSNN